MFYFWAVYLSWAKTVIVHHYRRLYDFQCKSVMKYSVFDDHAYYMNFTNNDQDKINQKYSDIC